jgi:hypothetical protein
VLNGGVVSTVINKIWYNIFITCVVEDHIKLYQMNVMVQEVILLTYIWEMSVSIWLDNGYI